MASGGDVNTDILSDETCDLLCTMCKRKHRNREAEKYCVDCHDFYCLLCVKVHDDVPSLNGHSILDKGQFPSGSSRALPMAPTQRCDRHNHKHVDMYCQNHDEVGCSTCMAVDHRPCQDTFYIPDFLQKNASTSTSADIQSKLDSAAKLLTEQQDKLQQEKQQLLKRKSETLKNIRKVRKEINDRLDELEKKSADEIESRYKPLINQIEKAIRLLRTNKATVQSARDKLAYLGKNVSQAFVNVKYGNKTANLAARCAEDSKTLVQVVDIEFKVDQKLHTLLEEMNALGMITQRNTKNMDEKTNPPIADQDQVYTSSQTTRQKKYRASCNVQKNVLLRVKEKKKYLIKAQSDLSTCGIFNVCVLEDGTIILSDKFNSKLKRLDTSTYTITGDCHLPENPWQVCPISKQEVAVSLSGKQEVHIVSVGSRMKISMKIKTDFDCRGLAYANGNLYISDYCTSIYMYNLSDSELKLFIEDPSALLFSDIRNLVVSKDGSKIYVSDFDEGLIVLDKNGQVVAKFNGPELNGATGCYLTDTGNLLVCGSVSGNVVQFGPDGELIGEVVKSWRLASYQAVCCNQQMSKLMIAEIQSDYLEVYDLV